MSARKSSSRAYWRSLEELADSSEAREALADEFPGLAAALRAHVDRRGFIKLMGATLALAGIGGCEVRPASTALPYVDAPAAAAGSPLYFTTTCTDSGEALGVIVKSVDGRPIKVEGNPAHPASRGATDIFAQAAVWSLFDPTRAQSITRGDMDSAWGELQATLSQRAALLARKQGAGLRILTEPVLSPSLAQQLRTVLAAFPQAQWHVHAPFGDEAVLAGAQLAFGEAVVPRYDLARAQTVFSLDADFLDREPGHLAYARAFMQARTGERMNRLYMVESTPTITGANADNRAGLRAGGVMQLAFRLAHDLGVNVSAGAFVPPAWYAGAVSDLKKREQGTSLVIAGRDQPPVVHALACAINTRLGNIGQAVTYAPSPAHPGAQPFAALVADMAAGQVDTLLILGGNPVYTAPADLAFESALARVPFTLALSLYKDETGSRTHWHVPAAHFLESWGDARAYEGSVSLVQPLIEPLYDGKTPYDILAAVTREPQTTAHAIVRKFWSNHYAAPDFEAFWANTLRAGVVAGTAHPARPVALRADAIARLAPPAPPRGLELRFIEDATIGDGRFAANAWLQELPKPLTKLTWENAAFVGPALAQARKLHTGDVVTLRYRGRSLVAPVWVLPGQPEDSIALSAGYGRAIEVGDARGANAYALRTHEPQAFGDGVELESGAGRYVFATTQQHQRMEGRNLVREALAGEIAPPWDEPLPSLYPPAPLTGTAWGMAIDLTRCIGCSACVIACQAENNIPVVGRDEVLRGHEMHWLRVDRYYRGEADEPHTVFQPVPCMHCEHAPCELVCPVGATLHDDQGLNLQVYNRCIGTRFCSNNCPYKVRRFNWFDYSGHAAESVKAARNPDVTVRGRGVMEKCTYCIQRIAAARIAADKDDRAIRDGEVVTACQGVCPTQAILFGDVHDPDSAVSQAKASPWNYALLHHLGTRPRTTYLTRLSNPQREEDGDNG